MMRKSFTMIELIIVMVIIGVISMFAIPNFTRAMNRARVRDAVLNLNVIHASNVLFRVRNGVNIGDATAPDGQRNSAADINVTLLLNILASGGSTYVCDTGTT
jgi:prepilin-type N-terminal cleavage/methylation domain-containing protein